MLSIGNGSILRASTSTLLNPSLRPRSFLSSRDSLVEPRVRATFSPAHPLADIFHPPYPPIASQSISRDVPFTRARVLQFSIPLLEGVAEAALYCAHPSHQLPSPSEPRHAGFAHTGRRPLADIFHALNVDGLIENQRDASRRPMHHNRIKKHP